MGCCLQVVCMGEVDGNIFEFWELSSHTIEEQLLMYDIPFTENNLAENIVKGPEQTTLSCLTTVQFLKKEIPEGEETLVIPHSKVKDQQSVCIESLIESLEQVEVIKTEYQNPDPESTATVEIKVDKYGFVVKDDTDESAQPGNGTNRDRAPVSRKKTHKQEEKWRIISKNLPVYLGEKRKKLKKLLRRGVPDSLRAEIWKGLMDVNTIKSEKSEVFHQLVHSECEADFERVILKDISRTLPKHIMFQEGGQGRDSLHRILKAYSLYNPNVGYCQGMGFLVGMFLTYMQEEDAFFMLVQVIDKLGLSGIFAEGLKAVKEHLYIHSQLCKAHFPKLSAHLEETVQVHGCMEIENPWDVAKLYATQWFFNIYVHVLPFEFILRIWDILLYDGFMVAHQVALAILKTVQKDLLKQDFDTLLMFLKDIDSYMEKNVSIDQFINTCVEYKIGSRISKLSKVYLEQFQNRRM